MSRRWSVDFLFQVVTAGCLALFISALPAGAAKYAAMVVDGYTGKMIYGKNIDAPRYPASITKVMTLYIVFEELRAGRLKKTSRLKVSKFASGQAPSRLGVKPGDRITVDTAIRALVTKSANDVATVIAENISGSQAKFARRMTKTARRLGMTKTTFRNPHGLPDRRQKTTARDLIKLSMRIQSDFPEYYGYFSVKTFTYRGRTYRNYNKLLGRFKGTTGIKTGYTRASGYNLTAVVKRGNKKVVAVVLGGKTGRARDAKMRELITRAFPKVVAYKAPRPAAPTNAPVPERKPGRAFAAATKPAPAVTEVLPVSGKVDQIAVASRREGVLVMRLAALAPRNREMPLAETISRDVPVRQLPIAHAITAPRPPAGALRLAQVDTGAIATTAYASPPNTEVISSIAALIANATGTMANPAETPVNLRPALPVANASALDVPALRPAALPVARAPDWPEKRIARLILPPSSTVAQRAANTQPPALRPAVRPTPMPVAQPQSRPALPPKPVVVAQPQVVQAQAPKPQLAQPEITLPEGYQIQVGAYVYKQKAEDRIAEVRKAARRLLSEAMGIAVPAENDKGKFYRARFAGLAKVHANQTCRALKKRRIACIVLSQ